MPNKTQDFLKGQIYVMEQRLKKAQARIFRAENRQDEVSLKHLDTERERAKRLSKLIELHKSNPEEALALYK